MFYALIGIVAAVEFTNRLTVTARTPVTIYYKGTLFDVQVNSTCAGRKQGLNPGEPGYECADRICGRQDLYGITFTGALVPTRISMWMPWRMKYIPCMLVNTTDPLTSAEALLGPLNYRGSGSYTQYCVYSAEELSCVDIYPDIDTWMPSRVYLTVSDNGSVRATNGTRLLWPRGMFVTAWEDCQTLQVVAMKDRQICLLMIGCSWMRYPANQAAMHIAQCFKCTFCRA